MDIKQLQYIAVAGVIAALIVGMISGLAINSITATSKPVNLTLVITDNNLYNSTIGDQPAYFVLTDKGLQSSANISVPAHTEIDLTIVNYDDGNASIAPQYAKVAGTVNNSMLLISDLEANAHEEPGGINLNFNDTQTVSSIPDYYVSHTFTVINPNNKNPITLNIPIEPLSTIHTDVIFNQTGTFHWQCFLPCGSGPDHWGGAMITNGWMRGSIKIT